MRVISRFLTLICLLAVLLLPAVALLANADDSVTFHRAFIHGASVCVVQADLNDPTVRIDVGLPAKGIAHSESFAGFVRRHAPVAAVTGIYFDIRTLQPTGTIVAGGRTVHESHIGTAVCFTPDNKVRFVDARLGEACDLSNTECGFRTGPRLLANGQYSLNPRREGFRHPGLYGARTRMALGVTAFNKLLLVFVRTPVTFSRLATIMKLMGATDAVCLDGGTSSAMYYKGQLIQRPGRLLTNVVEVLRRPALAPVAIARTGGFTIQISASHVSQLASLIGHRTADGVVHGTDYEPVAILADPIKLRFSKGLHTFFPVHRA